MATTKVAIAVFQQKYNMSNLNSGMPIIVGTTGAKPLKAVNKLVGQINLAEVGSDKFVQNTVEGPNTDLFNDIRNLPASANGSGADAGSGTPAN
jgi:hypothetical protein